MRKDDLKKFLKKIPTVPFREIEEAWIEVVLERNLGIKSLAAAELDISRSKIINMLRDGKIEYDRSKRA